MEIIHLEINTKRNNTFFLLNSNIVYALREHVALGKQNSNVYNCAVYTLLNSFTVHLFYIELIYALLHAHCCI